MKLSTREKRFVTIGAGILGVAMIVYVALEIIPDSAELSATVAKQKRLLLVSREMISRQEQYKARIEQYRQRIEKDKVRLLPGDNPSIAGAELQKVLKDMADRSGVEIVRRDLQRDQKLQDNLVKVSVKIETQCGPEQLVQFLAAVENYERYLTVDELAVNSFRIQKTYQIRPSITVSGYIEGPAPKPGEKT